MLFMELIESDIRELTMFCEVAYPKKIKCIGHNSI